MRRIQRLQTRGHTRCRFVTCAGDGDGRRSAPNSQTGLSGNALTSNEERDELHNRTFVSAYECPSASTAYESATTKATHVMPDVLVRKLLARLLVHAVQHDVQQVLLVYRVRPSILNHCVASSVSVFAPETHAPFRSEREGGRGRHGRSSTSSFMIFKSSWYFALDPHMSVFAIGGRFAR